MSRPDQLEADLRFGPRDTSVGLVPVGTVDEGTWTAVCDVSRLLPDRGVAALLPDGEQVAVFRTNAGEVFALSNVDPFSGAAVLSRGIVGDRGGVPVAVSPMLKQAFDLRTGVCVDDPTVSVAVYQVRLVEDGTIMVGSLS